MSQPRPTQLIGHTSFYDSGKDEKLDNSMTVDLQHDRCVLQVGPPADIKQGETVTVTSPTVLRHHRTMLAAMRRQSRRREVHPAPKAAKRGPSSSPASPICPTCRNTRWIEEPDTGRGYECPECGG